MTKAAVLIMKKTCIFVAIAVMLYMLSCCAPADRVEINSSQANIYKINYMDFPAGWSADYLKVRCMDSTDIYITCSVAGQNAKEIWSFSTDTMIPEYTSIDEKNIDCLSSFDGAKIYLDINNVIYKIDADGNEVFSFRELTGYDSSDTLISLDKDGNIYIACDKYLYVCSPNGEQISQMSAKHKIIFVSQIKNEKILLGFSESDDSEKCTAIGIFDITSNSIVSETAVPKEVIGKESHIIFAGSEFDLYILNDTAIYGWDLANSFTEIVNFEQSGIAGMKFSSVVQIDSKSFLGTIFNPSSYLYTPVILSARNEESSPVSITVACIRTGANLTEPVMAYNNLWSDIYQVNIKDYSQYNMSERGSEGYNVLINDIMAGNSPDMVFTVNTEAFGSLARKNAFCDIYGFLDESEHFSRDSLLECVKSPFEVDGKLIYLVSGYAIDSIAGKTSNLDGITSLTTDAMLNIESTLDESVSLFYDKSADPKMFIRKMAYGGFSEYVDKANAECSFESDSFIKLIDFLKKLNSEYDRSVFGDLFITDKYRNDEIMLYETQMSISTFGGYMTIRNMFGYEDITFAGYPNSLGCGTVVTPRSAYGIMDTSEKKSEAWGFLEYVLSCDSQPSADMMFSKLPVTQKGLEAIKNSVAGTYMFNYYNGSGVTWSANTEKETNMSSEYADGVDGELHIVDDEDFNTFSSLLNTATSKYAYDEIILSIINEEISAVYEGAKSSSEAAKIIQNRISIYLNE